MDSEEGLEVVCSESCAEKKVEVSSADKCGRIQVRHKRSKESSLLSCIDDL